MLDMHDSRRWKRSRIYKYIKVTKRYKRAFSVGSREHDDSMGERCIHHGCQLMAANLFYFLSFFSKREKEKNWIHFKLDPLNTETTVTATNRKKNPIILWLDVKVNSAWPLVLSYRQLYWTVSERCTSFISGEGCFNHRHVSTHTDTTEECL